jgi:hypothetical protein
MVGTLVVILPSEYSGGAVAVEHRGEKKVFRRAVSQATDLSLLAFYADCHHAVSPIKSGVRVALTYQLRLSGRSKAPRPTVRGDLLDRLTTGLREHFAVPVVKPYSQSEQVPPERLVYLLDHEYTQRSLSWSHLKNGDRDRVAALRAAAERLDCECFLALAEVHETWTCEDDDWRGRYGRRSLRSVEDAHAAKSEEYELTSLEDSTVALNHWLDIAGQRFEGVQGTVSDDELHFTKPSSDMDPFKSEHEGYQGNYGNTVDRWYQRAAFVTWPRANTFALRAQVSPEWAVDELMALPRANTAELEARVKTLLPRWGRTVGSVEGARFFAKLIRVATRIGDPALAQRWLLPLGLQRLGSQAMRRDLVALVGQHGLPWAKELLAEWTSKPHRGGTPAWAPLLADFCADLHAGQGAPCKALADWLLQRELKSALEQSSAALARPLPWLALEAPTDEAVHLAHVLAAAASTSAFGVIDETLSSLLRKKDAPTSFLVRLLLACIARSPGLGACVTGSQLHRECTERLRAVLSAPARAERDWTITYPLGCSCADCQVLSRFLASSRVDCDWPLNKERRQHLHRTIDSAQLPVLHTTLRRGSPHVLQLRKDRSLWSREEAYRARVKKILDALPRFTPGEGDAPHARAGEKINHRTPVRARK